ncbi:MAG: Eco57I restriction-modification methylase domain-containing protein [Leptospiraceae bacterium]|nr:Eco57I restriction-modification methylase domain-containing protein [Leptospiraceae bacterium]
MNTAVQTVIDRIIFLRIAEDRNMETYSDLLDSIKGENVYQNINQIFLKANSKYNSGLFKPENWVSNLKIDDKILHNIIKHLYYPDSPYEFSVLPIEILGNIYEQFLGKTIRLTSSHQAKVEEKEEVRKAGGVYYTLGYCRLHCEKYDWRIDHQAVEVTKLSLLLKLMEDENTESAELLFKHSDLKLLPDLYNNIKCGNSLIGSDFYEDKNLSLFGKEEIRKINVFDWEKEFPEIFMDSGFDVVIGNPPWIDIKGYDPVIVRYIFKKYQTTENRMNIYSTFIEKCFKILRQGNKNKSSFLGFITPNSFLTQSSYTKLRKFILNNYKIGKIVRLPDNTFKGVKAESAITIFETYQKTNDGNVEIFIYDRNDTIDYISREECKYYKKENQKIWRQTPNSIINLFLNNQTRDLLIKIENDKFLLKDLCDFSLGITPYDKYKGHSQKDIKDRKFHSNKKKDKNYKAILEGSNIQRYYIDGNTSEYINYGPWLGAPRENRFFIEPRILVRQIISGKPGRIFSGYTETELYNAQIAFNILVKETTNIKIKFILGVLNSTLITFYHRNKYLDSEKNVFQKILIQDCKNLPIPKLDLSNKIQKIEHDKLVSLVGQMLYSHEELHSATTEADKKLFQQKCDLLDKQIDKSVYELYGLTEEEIKIVEGKKM